MIYIIPYETRKMDVIQDRAGPVFMAELQKWVGVEPGHLEMLLIYYRDEHLTVKGQLWVDEDGKLRQPANVNYIASELLRRSLETAGLLELGRPEYIVGNAVFLTNRNEVT